MASTSQNKIDLIVSLSDRTKTAREIAVLVGASEETVRKYQIVLNLPRRQTGDTRPFLYNKKWTGTRHIDRDGYVLIPCPPSHPNMRKPFGRKVGKIAEHRLMAEVKIGRLLEKAEVVDHIDGCRLNNSLDNLRVFSSNAEHLKETLTGKVPQWSEMGKEKFQLARWHPEKAKSLFPTKICIYNQSKKQGDVRLQQILLAHELPETHQIWILGTKQYMERAEISWPLDQKRESDLLDEYRKILLLHPLVKSWIEG